MAATALTAGTRRVREAANIAAVIQQYTPLRKVGLELVGLCVFHKERSPSMSVNPANGFFHCHGCGAGGDVLSFVQRIEGISFMEARATLAEQYGIILDDRQLTRQEMQAQARQRVYTERLAVEAAAYWRVVLERYRARFETLKAIAWDCCERRDDPWWEAQYQRYARRTWRWGKIIRRLEGMEPVVALRRFSRVRMRLPVARLVDRELKEQAAEKEIWEVIMRNVVAERLDGVVEIMARAVEAWR